MHKHNVPVPVFRWCIPFQVIEEEPEVLEEEEAPAVEEDAPVEEAVEEVCSLLLCVAS